MFQQVFQIQIISLVYLLQFSAYPSAYLPAPPGGGFIVLNAGQAPASFNGAAVVAPPGATAVIQTQGAPPQSHGAATTAAAAAASSAAPSAAASTQSTSKPSQGSLPPQQQQQRPPSSQPLHRVQYPNTVGKLLFFLSLVDSSICANLYLSSCLFSLIHN